MHKIIISLFTLLSLNASAKDAPDFYILKKFPEDKRGFNIKTFWPQVEGADSYLLRVSRKSPSHYNTRFKTNKNFFFFKMYPWRLYKWDIQAFDQNGEPLNDPVEGKNIYLESQLFPKQDQTEMQSEFQGEEDNSFEAQSYVTEDGETDLLESPPVKIETEEPASNDDYEDDSYNTQENNESSEDSISENKDWYLVPKTVYQIGLGLGMTSYTYNQSINTRVDLDFSSLSLPSYHIFFYGQWNRFLGFIDYQSLPGTVDTTQSINGGKDYAWTKLNLSIGYQLAKFNLFGKTSILSPKLGYQMNDIHFIYIDLLDGINRKAPQLQTANIALHSLTELGEYWNLPIELTYLLPLSSSGDGGTFEINGGQGLQILAGLQWAFTNDWSAGLEWTTSIYDLDFKSNISNDQQVGNQKNSITNIELQLIYQF